MSDTKDTDTNTIENTGVDPHLQAAEDFFNDPANQDDDPKDVKKPDPKVEDKSADKKSDKDPEKDVSTDGTPNPLEAVLDLQKKDTPEDEGGEKDKDAEDDPIDKLTEPKDEKAKAGWNELKTIAKEARTEVSNLRAQIEDLKAKQTVTPEAHAATDERLAELRKENEAMSARLKTLDLKSHPDFQRDYILPQESKLGEMKAYVEEGTDLTSILSLPTKEFAAKISEVASDMDDFAKTQLYTLARDYRTLSSKAEEALKDVDSTSEQYTKHSQAHSKEVFDNVTKEYIQESKFKPQDIPEGVPEEEKAALIAYNEGYKNIRQEAENMAFGDVDETGVAKMAYEAALYRFSMKHGLPRLGAVVSSQIQAAQAEVAQLKDQIAAIKANKPTPDYGNESDLSTEDSDNRLKGHLEAAQDVDWSRR